MTNAGTLILKCPKCGHFLGEYGNFIRARCCGYEIIVSALGDDPLTRSATPPKVTATNQ